MTTPNSKEVVVIWEAPKIVPPEFRLYYDENGNVICYTCAKLEGNHIIIDAPTFAAARPDIRVINGKISTVQAHAVVSKLMPEPIWKEGQACAAEDISIVVDPTYLGMTMYWKMVSYEYE